MKTRTKNKSVKQPAGSHVQAQPIHYHDVTPEHRQLWAELEGLQHLVEEAFPEGHALIAIFRDKLRLHVDDYIPPLDDLHLLKNHVYSMGPATIHRILKGWSPRRDRPSSSDIVDEHASYNGGEQIYRVAKLTLDAGFGQKFHEFNSIHRFINEDDLEPVYLTVREGVDLSVVVRFLWRMLDGIGKNWQQAIQNECFMRNEKDEVITVNDGTWVFNDGRVAHEKPQSPRIVA